MNPASVTSPGNLRRRAGLLVTAIGLGWLLLAARLVQLQGWQRQDLEQRANRQRSFVQEITPRPGDIYDAQGRLLATTIKAHSLYVVPVEITDPWNFAQQLAATLNLNADDLFARLGSQADKHFLWVKRRLSETEVERVRALKLPAHRWGFREEYERVYPQGTLAAHVLGLRDIDGVGRGGVEQSCDEQLRGVPGTRRLICDALGRVIDVVDAVDSPRVPEEMSPSPSMRICSYSPSGRWIDWWPSGHPRVVARL